MCFCDQTTADVECLQSEIYEWCFITHTQKHTHIPNRRYSAQVLWAAFDCDIAFMPHPFPFTVILISFFSTDISKVARKEKKNLARSEQAVMVML